MCYCTLTERRSPFNVNNSCGSFSRAYNSDRYTAWIIQINTVHLLSYCKEWRKKTDGPSLNSSHEKNHLRIKQLFFLYYRIVCMNEYIICQQSHQPWWRLLSDGLLGGAFKTEKKLFRPFQIIGIFVEDKWGQAIQSGVAIIYYSSSSIMKL